MVVGRRSRGDTVSRGYSMRGMGLAERFLESPDFDYPTDADIDEALNDSAYCSGDKKYPLRGGNMTPIRHMCNAMGIQVQSLESRRGEDGGLGSTTISYMHMKLGSTKRDTVYRLLKRMVEVAPNGGAAWYAIAAVCYAPFERGESFYSKRAHVLKVRKVTECAERLDPESLNSLYLIACSLSDSQRIERARTIAAELPKTEFSKALVVLDYERRDRYNE